jgi:hypothetical protein
MRIAPGIHRIGDQSIVNAYLLEDAGEVTIIDAGVPQRREYGNQGASNIRPLITDLLIGLVMRGRYDLFAPLVSLDLLGGERDGISRVGYLDALRRFRRRGGSIVRALPP